MRAATAEARTLDVVFDRLGAAQSSVPESWRPQSLGAYFDGGVRRPETTILQRSDGTALLYPGLVHLLFGRPESGKSWLAMLAVAEVVRCGGRAVVIDLESDGAEISGRLVTLGLDHPEVERVRYIRPHEPLPLASAPADVARVAADLGLGGGVDVVVVDALGELFSLHGLDPLSNRDAPTVTNWLRRLGEHTGAAVVALDHVPHTPREGGSGAPIGAQHKLAAVTGAAYEARAVQPLAPGKVGEVRVFIVKDRPGAVRAASEGKTAAVVTLDAESRDGRVLAAIDPAAGRGDRGGDELRQRVAQHLRANPGASTSEVRREVGGKAEKVSATLDALVSSGEVVREHGKRGAHKHYLRAAVGGPG